jgi:TolB-like protein
MGGGLMSATTVRGVSYSLINKIARRAKRLRLVIRMSGCASPKIAAALGVAPEVVRRWSEGFDIVPDDVFAVLNQAFDRYLDALGDEDEEAFATCLTRYAQAHRICGFA